VELSIIYEDEILIAINKDSGIPVIPGRGENSSDSLLQITEQSLSKKLYVVHRIDKDTSGVIMFAKDAQTHRYLNILFEKRDVEKHYLAVVNGIPENGFVIDAPVFEFGSGRMGIDKRGKPSKTRFEIEEKMINAAQLDVCPSSGRRHQIRVHLYSIGFPILGDRIYGYPRPVGGIDRLMLHAKKVCFLHPDGNMCTITAPVSEQWSDIVSKLKIPTA